jgi:hypothetical protein
MNRLRHTTCALITAAFFGFSGPIDAAPPGDLWGDPDSKAYTLKVTGGSTSTTTISIGSHSISVQTTTFTCADDGRNCKLGPGGHFVGKP